ncbi:hypothetical protein ACGFMK_29830 [Amycolatopsis sp. NPDC049252]|uniref:hypothetical protein n=1 Tax=Amycolatopsis sp. NPDC049252 TaxID=3363933 RepID=UPI00371314A4
MLKNRTTAKKVGAVVAAAASVAGMVFGAAPATAAAYPTSSFKIQYGESYYNGTVTFFNRSVGVTGAFKASNCRRIYVKPFAGSTRLDFKSTSLWCNTAGTAPVDAEADVPGGADNVWVYMTDETDAYLKGVTCYRGSSPCIDGLH